MQNLLSGTITSHISTVARSVHHRGLILSDAGRAGGSNVAGRIGAVARSVHQDGLFLLGIKETLSSLLYHLHGLVECLNSKVAAGVIICFRFCFCFDIVSEV